MSTLSSGPGGSMGKGSGGATTSAASATAKTVSPPTGASAGNKKRLNNSAGNAAVEDSRFKVDKKIVDELLLVCGVIGTNMGDGVGIVPVTDCLNWLQDMQRALRRDDDAFRPISLLLGQWNVVSQKLFPLCLSCRYDTPMLLTICKILVILTKPLSENTVRAGKMVIDTKSKNATPEFIKEQIKLRDNALQQAEQLLEYKRAICHHPSHRRSRKKNKEDNKDSSGGGDGSGGLLSIFVSLLAEPLGKSRRTDADHLTIELVLHLFRNLLAAEPLLQHDSTSNAQARQLHHEFIQLLDNELVLEILLVLSSDLEQRENAPYNLLVMEILQHLLRHEDPMAVARSSANQSSSSSTSSKSKSKSNKTGGGSLSLLGQTMQREKQTLAVPTMNRHSNFGGTLALKRPHGGQDAKPQYVSTSALAQRHEPLSAAAAASSGAAGGDGQHARRKNKRNEPFIGAATSRLQHGRRNRAWHDGPAAQKAARCLHQFCLRFLQECYGPVMKSLKNEFRRDSVRLEDGDRVVFFRLVWFFSQWWRVTTSSGKHPLQASAASDKKASSTASSTAIGQLIFTMDVFTFNLVLNATDTFIEHKKYARLGQAVSLLAEMMHLLFVLHNSPESTETIMAMGLMDRLFYGTEPMDRLSKLLSKWEPGTGTREYACDLVEVVHMQLKLLESNRAKAAADKHVSKVDKKQKGRKKKGEIDEESAPSDAVANMKAIAADFDVLNYLRKLITNHSVFLYTQLLGQYAVNAPQVNHRLVAFFLRLSKFKIVLPENDGDDQDEMLQNPLAIKTVTLEPMLYNINMLQVLNTILNDSIIRHDKDYTTTLQFASNLMFNFSQAAAANPMLYVEALLKHSAPARFCDSVTNQYVTEELRMMVERDMLLEDQQQRREAMFDEEDGDDGAGNSNSNGKADKNGNDDDDDSDEELEFEDFGLISGSSQKSTKTKGKKQTKAAKSKRKVLLEDSDDDDDKSDDEGAAMSKPDSDDDDDKSNDEGDATSEPASDAAKHSGPASKYAGNQTLDDDDDKSDDEGAATSKPASHAVKKSGEQGLDDSDDEYTAQKTTKASSDDESSTASGNAARHLKKNKDEDNTSSSPKSRPTAKAATAFDKDEDSDDSTVDGNGATGEKSSAEKVASDGKKKRSKPFEDDSDDDDESSSSGEAAKKQPSGHSANAASQPNKKKARTTEIDKDDSSDSESDDSE